MNVPAVGRFESRDDSLGGCIPSRHRLSSGRRLKPSASPNARILVLKPGRAEPLSRRCHRSLQYPYQTWDQRLPSCEWRSSCPAAREMQRKQKQLCYLCSYD
jgi:hypothetical protein